VNAAPDHARRDDDAEGESRPSRLRFRRCRVETTWIDADPERLAASIDLPAVAPPWPWLMLVHGLGGHRLGNRSHFVEFGRRLAAAGIACVRFDQSGCGESSGDPLRYGLETIRADARAVLDWTSRDPRFDVRRWLVLGASQGALGAIAVDAEAPHAARGLALWAPVYDLAALAARVAAERDATGSLRRFGFASHHGVRFGPAYFDQLRAIDPDETLARRSSPLLVCHSRRDGVVPYAEAERYRARCATLERPCRVLRFHRPTHDFFEDPDRYRIIHVTARWAETRLGVAHHRLEERDAARRDLGESG